MRRGGDDVRHHIAGREDDMPGFDIRPIFQADMDPLSVRLEFDRMRPQQLRAALPGFGIVDETNVVSLNRTGLA